MINRANPRFSARLAEFHLTAGLLFFGLAWGAKEVLPNSLRLQPFIQLPCAFLASVLIPLGSLWALWGLMSHSVGRRSLLICHVIGVLFAFVLLAFYFYVYAMNTQILTISKSLPNILPKLIENAGTFPTEEKRIYQARWAYRLYGSVIAYRSDKFEVLFYVPTQDDIDFRREQKRLDAQIDSSSALLAKVDGQFPYLFGLYAATFAATFLVGGIWMAVKIPALSPAGRGIGN
jgi:hypothetical protein